MWKVNLQNLAGNVALLRLVPTHKLSSDESQFPQLHNGNNMSHLGCEEEMTYAPKVFKNCCYNNIANNKIFSKYYSFSFPNHSSVFYFSTGLTDATRKPRYNWKDR